MLSNKRFNVLGLTSSIAGNVLVTSYEQRDAGEILNAVSKHLYDSSVGSRHKALVKQDWKKEFETELFNSFKTPLH